MDTRPATRILLDAGRGDADAAARLLALVQDELRALAAGYLRRERAGHTLQPTALVNEAYLKLVNREDIADADRERFLRIAARAMRRVLVDHARRRDMVKRGGGDRARVTLHDAVAPPGRETVDLVALNDAMDRLAEKKTRLAEVVELRFFGGLTVAETARALGVSTTTIDNDWFVARAWLARELGGAEKA
jgi:RNA polymerase sigma factor (TIGR02999 family)